MVLNILLGGLDGESDSRLRDQITLIRRYRPDVLCLPEATHWHNRPELLEMVETQTGLATAMLARGDGHHNIALMYNPTRLRVIGEPSVRAARTFHHALIRAVLRPVDAPDDRADVLALGTHFNPCDLAGRLSEARWITDYGGRFNGVPPRSVLLGDLNIPDREPSSWDLVPENLQSRFRILNPDGSYGGVDRQPLRALKKAGWQDPHDLLSVTRPPTVGHYYPEEPVPWAIDYALLAGDLEPVQVYTHPWSTDFKVSDHLPHFVDVALPQ
nr:endonuclease/exonuclease/phosphatase family protein [Streptomyces sp. NBC_00899]